MKYILVLVLLGTSFGASAKSVILCGQGNTDDIVKAQTSLNLLIDDAEKKGYTDFSAPTLQNSTNRSTAMCVTASTPKVK